MFTVKGFAVNSQFTVNTPGTNNLFGELSTQSLTYSKEKGFYTNITLDNLALVAFKTVEDNVVKALPSTLSDHILTVCNYVYNYMATNINQTVDPTALAQALSAEYAAVASNFVLGTIESDGTYSVPDWVSWKQTANNANIRIWFVDNAFLTQYDEYELVFVPPITPLDNFFNGGAAVQTLLEAVSTSDVVAKLQAAIGNKPETFFELQTFDYYDPNDDTRIVPSYWGIVGYGVAGNNIDVLKEALINYILANSTHSREEWAAILPDLFKRTEFVIVPLWSNYAIEPRTTTPGIYSPISKTSFGAAFLKTVLPSYPAHQIDTYSMIMGFPFKSITVLSVGNEENRNSKYMLTDYFPDFINVSSTSQDFNRMVEDTKNWSLMIHQLMVYAETATPDTALPLTVSKVTRDNVFYLSQLYDNIQYLVASKYSVDSLSQG